MSQLNLDNVASEIRASNKVFELESPTMKTLEYRKNNDGRNQNKLKKEALLK